MVKHLVGSVLAALGVAAAIPTEYCRAQVATTIRVRVVAHDAKVIGSSVGGARVYVRAPSTGEILAEGVQEGGTGDTRAIVIDPVKRGAAIFDSPNAAVFTARLTLNEPTVLEFVGEGPLGFEHAMQRAVKSMLVVPGEDILGDGVVLELHGFIVELLEPREVVAREGDFKVVAKVRMMCGCPLEPGGLWDADRVRVKAVVYRNGDLIQSADLAYAGTPNTFEGEISVGNAVHGAELIVVASDRSRINFGKSPATTIK
ncbi:MAG: hypothetical protein ACE5HT_03235 [Gemmatimonadales bacterium]